MEAKDTVMSSELQKVYEGNQLAGLEWQAEITWKAAIKEERLRLGKLMQEHLTKDLSGLINWCKALQEDD